MRPIEIRDLETGEVIVRHGSVAEEILSSHEPLRDEDGNIVFDADGVPEKSHKRFVRVGTEPRKWKEAQAAKAAGEPVPDESEDEDAAPKKRGQRKRL